MIGNIRRPDTVAFSKDPALRTMTALLNRAGRNLSRERGTWGAGWSVLQREHEFETVADQASYDLPNGFQQLIGNTVWDRTQYWSMRGTLSPMEWQTIKSGLIETTGLQRRFTIRRGDRRNDRERKFFIDPVPTTDGDVLVFDYMDSGWVYRPSDGSTYDHVLNDSDEPLLDEGLLVMDLVWRYRHAKGLEYLLDMTEWEQQKMLLMGQDHNVPDVELGRGGRRFAVNVPETGFGGVSA